LIVSLAFSFVLFVDLGDFSISFCLPGFCCRPRSELLPSYFVLRLGPPVSILFAASSLPRLVSSCRRLFARSVPRHQSRCQPKLCSDFSSDSFVSCCCAYACDLFPVCYLLGLGFPHKECVPPGLGSFFVCRRPRQGFFSSLSEQVLLQGLVVVFLLLEFSAVGLG
jgi:hypothetical protein